MTLLERVVTDLRTDEARAVSALQPLFMVLKLSTSRTAFEQIQAVVPQADDWARQGARGDAGRTGELLALVTPASLPARLAKSGFTHAEIEQLGETVGLFLATSGSPDLLDEISQRVPLVVAPAREGVEGRD